MRLKMIYLAMVAVALTALRAASVEVPEQSVVLAGIDEESFRERLEATDIQPLEGIWYYPNEEMTIGIERWRGDHNIEYRLVLLSSDDVELLPGTVMGFMAPSAVDNKLQLWLYSQRRGISLRYPLECVATVNSTSDVITFEPPRWKVKVKINFARFLPTLFRGITITPEHKSETLPIGFKKLFPAEPGENRHLKVRYL